MAHEFEGQGGSYTVDKDGKRTLIHRTQDSPARPRAPEPKGKQKSKTDEVTDA